MQYSLGVWQTGQNDNSIIYLSGIIYFVHPDIIALEIYHLRSSSTPSKRSDKATRLVVGSVGREELGKEQ